ncbi:MAG TPA: ABC transporter permease [Terriglobales bacterium]|nr:ABC transporter permease [Terriglobales bacterium]
MRYHRLRAIAWKELVQISRDSRSIAIVVIMPLVLMLAFGYGVSFDIKHVRTYVFDRDGSQQSQDFLKRLQASEYFHIVRGVETYRDLIDGIDRGDCVLGVVIAPDFSEKVKSGGMASVQVIVDATDANSANVAMNYVEALGQDYARRVQATWIERRGQRSPEASLNIAARTWFNEDLESMANIVPGVIAIVMAVVGTFLTSLTIAREWERGTMEQLVSTPISPIELMIGKLAPYLVIGLLDTFLCAAIGVWWFQVPFRGTLSLFFLTSVLFLLVVLSMGYVLSVVMKSQLAASQMSMVVTFLPAFLLSGFIFPIDQMPRVIQVVTYIIPARYFMAMIRAVFLKGTPIVLLWTNLLALIIFATVLVLVATRAFRKQLG